MGCGIDSANTLSVLFAPFVGQHRSQVIEVWHRLKAYFEQVEQGRMCANRPEAAPAARHAPICSRC